MPVLISITRSDDRSTFDVILVSLVVLVTVALLSELRISSFICIQAFSLCGSIFIPGSLSLLANSISVSRSPMTYDLDVSILLCVKNSDNKPIFGFLQSQLSVSKCGQINISLNETPSEYRVFNIKFWHNSNCSCGNDSVPKPS